MLSIKILAAVAANSHQSTNFQTDALSMKIPQITTSTTAYSYSGFYKMNSHTAPETGSNNVRVIYYSKSFTFNFEPTYWVLIPHYLWLRTVV